MSNWALAWSSIAMVSITSILIHLIEPDKFPTVFDGFWWVMTTITTVGYGDEYPVTIGGRLIGIFLFLFGISLLGIIIGKITDSFSILKNRREEGRVNFHGKNHIVIIGWSQKARYAIKDIHKKEPDTEIVLIDQLEKTPIPNKEHVVYIQGAPSREKTLVRANIEHAKSVLIFSDDRIEHSSLADGQTLLIATTIERIAPEVYTVAEIRREEHMANFSFVHVNDFVLSHEHISRMAVKSALLKERFELRNQYEDDDN